MQLFWLVILLIISIIVAVGVGFWVYWPLNSAPYVPTNDNEVDEIFKIINFSKGKTFCDVGCGDGRMVFAATKYGHSKAIGVEINLGLVIWDRLIAKIQRNRLVEFWWLDFNKKDLPKCDVYYLYLWGWMLKKVARKIWTINPQATIVTKAWKIEDKKYVKNFVVKEKNYWVYKGG